MKRLDRNQYSLLLDALDLAVESATELVRLQETPEDMYEWLEPAIRLSSDRRFFSDRYEDEDYRVGRVETNAVLTAYNVFSSMISGREAERTYLLMLLKNALILMTADGASAAGAAEDSIRGIKDMMHQR